MILQALLVADIVLIALGSANAPRRHDYVPFTAAERETMIRLMLTPDQNLRVRFVYVEDQGDMPTWSGIIRVAANKIEADDSKITLIGHSKDNSSYYLKGFPGWVSHDVDNYMGLSATTYRKPFFERDFDPAALVNDALHPEVQRWMREFMNTIEYAMLVEEAAKCAKDIQDYGRIDPATGEKVYGPYLAADAIYIQGDYVLLIERGGHPYKGCLALPGGFVEADEDVVEAAIRESNREEAKMKVPEIVIRKSYVGTVYYSAPHRDPRGRVVSASSLFHFDPVPPPTMTDPKEIARYIALPRVVAGDDAAKAFWTKISGLSREKMAFDHWNQIQRALQMISRNY